MVIRIITGILGALVFIAQIIAPYPVPAIAVLAITGVMLFEMYLVLKQGTIINILGYLSAVIIAASILFDFVAMGMFLLVAIYLFGVVLTHGKKEFSQILAHGFVTLFITLFMLHIVLLMEKSIFDALWIFIIAWVTDTGAYFSGVFLGKHKLVPHISPKKTVEGAVGGVLATTVLCVVYGYILFKTGIIQNPQYINIAIMGFLGSVLSQIGDFAASCIKRDNNIKDFGSILPGHGGFMDRFDSVVFIAPFVYYMLSYLY